ncbi:prepilin-type N-terminal cleavage/methylation domain-containing protein [Rosistilla carotiformis]|nr:prepilin-type N-terminal cleavage/methylation domain-containing protein [Rosistilla carotiformis]
MSHPLRPRTKPPRTAFTLIELLVVIIIIGILASLVTAGVVSARSRMIDSALKVELTNVELALEAYRDKYGDYPPDFSDWAVVQRHYRTAFPKISAKDMGLLSQACFVDPTDSTTFQINGIDRAEALVFALGGFSSDPRFPFSGSGGPFVYVGTGNVDDLDSYHYNTSRDNRLFEFDEVRLTMGLNGVFGYSTDEGLYWNTSTAALGATVAPNATPAAPSGVTADLFPVYRRRNDETSLPFVYFDSRTYSLGTTSRAVNVYQPTAGSVGVAKPYKSLLVNTGTTSSIPDDGLFFVNRDSFQIVSGGQDEHYGGDPSAPAMAYIFPAGTGFNLNSGLVAGVGNYLYTPDPTNFQEDNVTNFSSTTLESDLE